MDFGIGAATLQHGKTGQRQHLIRRWSGRGHEIAGMAADEPRVQFRRLVDSMSRDRSQKGDIGVRADHLGVGQGRA